MKYNDAIKILELNNYKDYDINIEIIKKKYKSLALLYHPDKNIHKGSTEKFQINSPGLGWKYSRIPHIQNSHNKGLLYWNNGIKNKMSKDCPGLEWVSGMLPKNKPL